MKEIQGLPIIKPCPISNTSGSQVKGPCSLFFTTDKERMKNGQVDEAEKERWVPSIFPK